MTSKLRSFVSGALAAVLSLGFLSCASAAPPPPATPPVAKAAPAPPVAPEPADEAPAPAPAKPPEPPFPSTYQPIPSQPVLITNATILTAAGNRLQGSILLRDGKVAAVGANLDTPAGATVVDGKGKWVTPGIIDAHSHLGVYAAPGVEANSDGNEATNPNTAEVWAEHSVWPQDPQFPLALAGGVTAMQILPGSANLFGGRSVTVKNVPATSVYAMKFPGAPYGLKMACGENPKRVYGSKGRSPATRMGNVAGYRAAWIKAREYMEKWDRYEARKKAGKEAPKDATKDGGREAEPPTRDLQLETLAGVLRGEILVQNHCYRADEMLTMIDVAKEFGYKVTAFHHAVEAYKIADVLAANGICADMWADWWGFKMEAFDGIRENIALVEKAGACAIVHSDSADGIQRLNQEAAKAMAAGNRMGMHLKEEDAIRWLTINPAKSLGIGQQTGSLEAGKMADVVLWSGNPFSVYSRAEKVYIDGALVYDRNDPAHQPEMDFELGIRDAGEVQ
ncbi:MAG TPA: amidohydrolase [Thermoanaerobaculia bacterium]|nr:amidohydrolase [Thermoanaerobaculia bacterium]